MTGTRSMTKQLSREEFADNLLAAAASPERVSEVLSQFLRDDIKIGPVCVGPAGVGTATASGTIANVIVAATSDGDWDYHVAVPVELNISVALVGREVRYHIDLIVRVGLRLLIEEPCTVFFDVETVQPHHVSATIDPAGVPSRLLGWIGNIDSTVEDHVVTYINTMLDSPDMVALRRIDVCELIDRAWQFGLVAKGPTTSTVEVGERPERARPHRDLPTAGRPGQVHRNVLAPHQSSSAHLYTERPPTTDAEVRSHVIPV